MKKIKIANGSKGPRKSSANPPRINYMKEVLQQSCEILFKDLIN